MRYKQVFFSLPESIQAVVCKVVENAHPKQVILFGSQARKDHRENSDFDLCVIQKNCHETAWTKILVDISEEPWSLYRIDLVEFEKLNDEYKKNIHNDGVILYE